MKKKGAAAFMTAAAIALSGCFGGREVNKRSFVQIIGLEKSSGLYNLSLQLFKPESSDGRPDITKANSSSVTGRGATIGEAFAQAEMKAGKSLFTGHAKLLILGDGLNDPSDELEVLYDENLSSSCPVVYSRKPSEITEALPEEGMFSAERILNIMETYVCAGKSVYTSAAELSEAAEVTESGFALPVIYADGKEVYFSGAALGSGGGLHGTVPESSQEGMILLMDAFPDNGRITVPVEINGMTVSAEIIDACCKKSVSYSDGQLSVEADIKLEIRTDDSSVFDEKQTGTAVCEKVKDSVVDAFSAAVWENGCDIFGITKLVRRDCPELYEAVTDSGSGILKDCRLNVKVHGRNV